MFVQAENFVNQDENFKLGGNIDLSIEPKGFPRQLLYASSASESFGAFKPITQIESSLTGQSYSSLIKTGLLYTLKPISSLYVSLSSDGLCSFNSDSALVFEGIQWALESKWQIVSDIYLSVAGQQFISLIDEIQNQFVVALKLGFTF